MYGLWELLLFINIASTHGIQITRNYGPDEYEYIKSHVCATNSYKTTTDKVSKCKCNQGMGTFASAHRAQPECFSRSYMEQKGCKNYTIVAATRDYVSVDRCNKIKVEYIDTWNYTHQNIGEWNIKQFHLFERSSKQLFQYEENKITFNKRKFWDGLLVRFHIVCDGLSSRCIVIKFIGKRTYPLPNNLQGILQVHDVRPTETTTTTTGSTKDGESSSNSGVIIGTIIGLLLLILVTIMLILFILRKRRRRRRNSESTKELKEPLKQESKEYAVPDTNKQHSIKSTDSKECSQHYYKPDIKTEADQHAYYELEESKYHAPNNISQKDSTKLKPTMEYAKVNKDNIGKPNSLKQSNQQMPLNDDSGNYYSPAICTENENKPAVEYAQINKKNKDNMEKDNGEENKKDMCPESENQPSVEYSQVNKNITTRPSKNEGDNQDSMNYYSTAICSEPEHKQTSEYAKVLK